MAKKITMDATVKDVSFNEEKSRLSIRVYNRWEDGSGGDGQFFDFYGNYGKTLHEKGVIQPGDVVLLTYEERNKAKVDAATGTAAERKDYKYGVSIRRIYRPANPQSQPAPVNEGLNDDTW